MSGPQVIEITSLNDPRVDVYRNVRDADLRGRERLFMAESELVLRRLMRTPKWLHSMLLSHEKFQRMRDAIAQLPPHLPVYVADLQLIHEIAAFHVHRGCLAAGIRPSPEELSLDAVLAPLHNRESFCVLLTEGVTNVDNMGGLFRNAAAFGVDAVVLDPTSCDPLYRKAIRVSMGYALSIPYAISADWLADLHRLKSEWGDDVGRGGSDAECPAAMDDAASRPNRADLRLGRARIACVHARFMRRGMRDSDECSGALAKRRGGVGGISL